MKGWSGLVDHIEDKGSNVHICDTYSVSAFRKYIMNFCIVFLVAFGSNFKEK